jgi:hypothetical protein
MELKTVQKYIWNQGHTATEIVGSELHTLTFFTSRLGGAGGVWLVSMNKPVFRLSGAEHKTQSM